MYGCQIYFCKGSLFEKEFQKRSRGCVLGQSPKLTIFCEYSRNITGPQDTIRQIIEYCDYVLPRDL
jgi:hypothetical protein